MAKFFINESPDLKNLKSKYLQPFVDTLLNDPKVIKLLTTQYDYDKSITTLKRLMLLPTIRIACLNKDDLANKLVSTVREEFYRSYDILNIDTKFSMMLGLSILELTLVVVMLEMSQLFPEQPFNFDLIFNAYYKFCQKRNWGQQKYEKQIILKVNILLSVMACFIKVK